MNSGALGGDDLLDRALGDHALEAVLHDFRKAARRRFLVPVRREVIALDVGDAPLHEEVNVQDLALARQELLRGIVPREQAAVELLHRLERRHDEMQARLEVGGDDPLEAELDCEVRLLDLEHRRARNPEENEGRDHALQEVTAHQRSFRARGSSASTSLPSSMRTVGGVSAAPRAPPRCSSSLSSGR